MPSELAALALPFHSACLSFVPQSQSHSLHAALVCGQDLPASTLSQALKVTGLIHLIVVSGSHLIFLEAMIKKISPRHPVVSRLVLPLLGIYCLMTALQPPVVRAFLAMALQRLSAQAKLYWTRQHVTLLAGLLTLGICPQWLHSYSLLLSWAAAMALCHSEGSPLSRQTKLYLLLFPLLLPLAAPHPLSIFLNLLLGPLLGIVLFPSSLAAMVFPALTHLLDHVWHWLEVALIWLATILNSTPPLVMPIARSWLWVYLLGLELCLLILEVRRRRQA